MGEVRVCVCAVVRRTLRWVTGNFDAGGPLPPRSCISSFCQSPGPKGEGGRDRHSEWKEQQEQRQRQNRLKTASQGQPCWSSRLKDAISRTKEGRHRAWPSNSWVTGPPGREDSCLSRRSKVRDLGFSVSELPAALRSQTGERTWLKSGLHQRHPSDSPEQRSSLTPGGYSEPGSATVIPA